MRLVQHALVLFASWLLSAFAYDLHKQMTIEEIRNTFHVDHHNDVPDYEVVHLHRMRKRSVAATGSNSLASNIDTRHPTKSNAKTYEDSTKIRLKAFGKPLNLSLVKNENLIKKGGLKMWTVHPNSSAQHGVEYVELPQVKEDIGELYQDEENEAAILLRQETNGGLIVEGSIGSDLVIRPVPERLRPELPTTVTSSPTENPTTQREQRKSLHHRSEHDDDEMFLDEDGELNGEVAIDTGFPLVQDEQAEETVGHQHIIYKRKNNAQDSYSDYVFMEPDHLAKRYRRSTTNNVTVHSRKKREAPYTIYPEILVIVDYDGYRLHSGDNAQIKRYFISFWNGVDLRYKLLKGPKVRISIAGIIISRGRDATPYLERNRVGRDAIDSAAALTDMGKYLFRERRLPVYDIAVAITKYDMCRRRKGGRCTKGTAGFAYVGGACVVNKRLEKVNSVAIIEDTGGFSGIIVAAHEVGHLLGAVHDGSPPPSYLGGPGAEKCQWTDGYIMSDLRHTERGFRWSPCSISSFHHFLNGDTATCLYNAPHEEESLPRVLPGKLMSLDAQCRRDRGTSACFKDDRVCAQLFCFDATSGYCVAYRPAAEGSSCGDGQSCANGKCVPENENIIPDYSQNTPSYVRRNGPDQGRSLYDSQSEDNLLDTYNYDQTTTPYPYTNQYQNDNPPDQKQHYNNNRNPSTTSNFYYSASSTTEQSSFFNFGPQWNTKSPLNSNNFRNQNTQQSTTENSYNHHFTQSSTTKRPLAQSQTNPYVGNYYQLIKQTTKNPYDFANFRKQYRKGKSAFNSQIQDIQNNNLKTSYNSTAPFDSSNNSENVRTQDETT